MPKILLIIFICSFTISNSFGQKKKKLRSFLEETELQARGYMDFEQFEEARSLWIKLDSASPNDPMYNYYIGVCYMRAEQPETALSYLKFAKENGHTTDNAYVIELDYLQRWNSLDIDFNLGRAYHMTNKFDRAISHYRAFEEKVPESARFHDDEIDVMDRFIEQCLHAKSMMKYPVKGIKITNVGDAINSKWPDYVPFVSADEQTMVFTSIRHDSATALHATHTDLEYTEDIFIAYKNADGKWGKATPISPNINSIEHESCIFLSHDGQYILIYKSNHHNTGSIWESKLNGNEWSTPVKLPEGINSRAWDGSASISANGQWMFISSTRNGGAGLQDIYWAKKKPNGEWGPMKNMGPSINTKFNEDAPFIHPDGKTLYFSSVGHFGMGGYDIFKSEYDEATDSWSKAENIGYPINTVEDDIFFVFSVDGKHAYFSSHRKDTYGDKDIYMLTMPTNSEASLSLYKGTVISHDKQPISAKITVTDMETGKIEGVYRNNTASGQYSFVVPNGHSFKLTVESDGLQSYIEIVKVPDNGKFNTEVLDFELN